MAQAFFITGTDTGVGKTLIATALLRLARDSGLTALGLKPVAAGCALVNGEWMNKDAQQLLRASSGNPDYATVNPVALREPMAPHIAAERENRPLQAAELVQHCKAQLASADFTVIEGAGGWLVPLNARETMADIAVGIGCPVILVTGLRLGCINHTLLTAAAIAAAGLPLAGWVANQIDPDMAVADANIETLRERLNAPLLGCVPYLATQSPMLAAKYLALPELFNRRQSATGAGPACE
jgi:dethiobiotin synthetase